MATVPINVNFTKNPLSTGTLIKYRTETGPWITPTSPANPTSLSTYPLELEESTKYYISTTSIGTNCTEGTQMIVIVTGAVTCCPVDYTLSPDGTYCYKIETVPATPPSGGTPETSVPKSFAQYSKYGATIYDIGFNINGTGTNSRIIPLSNLYWGNPSLNTTDGALNRTGLWGTTETANQLVGFSYCFDLATSATYYIGCAADNEVVIRLDGTTILSMDEATITTYLYSQYGIVDPSYNASYTFWHIYPVVIPSGPHIIEVIGRNGSVAGLNPAAFGAEIYSNTAAELQAASSSGDLNIIFTTETLRSGEPLQIGTDGVGYTCPSGYSLDSCVEPYTCKRQLTTGTIC